MDKWVNYFLEIAHATAKLSYAEKLKVGAVAVRNNRVISTGYNGTPPGADNTCEDFIIQDGVGSLKSRPDVEHAERNLIYYAARHGIKLEGSTLYITHSPCVECARAILFTGFSRVVWRELHKNGEGLNFLDRHNIPNYYA